MGESKRRKQLDPNYGKPLQLIINPDLPLTPKLKEVKQVLLEKLGESTTILGASLEVNDKSYPIILVPNIKTHQGKEKMYCEVAFDPSCCPPNVNQKLIDSISNQASKKIVNELRGKQGSLTLVYANSEHEEIQINL